MPSMQDLIYSIEANTQGLQTAFAPIEKLEKTLNSLAKTIRSLTKTFTEQANTVAQVQNTSSGNVKKNTDKIVEQLKRQQAALINSTQKLLNLNQTLGKTGASTKAIDANLEALRELDKILKDGTISSADATLARAKFNAVLSESNRALKEVKEAQSVATRAQKDSDASLLKQSNALERVRLQYQALSNAMEDAGSTPMHFAAANKAFGDFAKAMSSGVLSAEEFSEAINKSNASLQMIKRGAGVEKTLADSVGKTEEALKRQDVRLLAAKQKLDALSQSVKAFGASPALVNTATTAYDELDKVLKNTSTSAADASLAAAKYNAVLKEQDRLLDGYVASQREAEKSTKLTEVAMLKQRNKVADAAIQFENLRSKLSRLGEGNKHIKNLESAFAQLQAEMNSAALSSDKFSDATNKWKKAFADIKRESGAGGGISQLNDGMRELVQSSQLLLGPLSGVASRIQNLVGLARAGGLAFAGMVTGGLGLGFALYKAIQAGVRFEAQMASINAVLKATGNEAFMTGDEVAESIHQIGNATGSATADLRQAAAGILTMSGMTDELFEKSLRAAEGLAQIGGSTVQTTFRNLMQTLQEPAQAFQTLTQYGVKFDAMQQRIITRLVNQGKHQEAVNKIFEKLNPIIAGATAKADTFAGAWNRVKNNTEQLMVDFINALDLIPKLTAAMNLLADAISGTGNKMGELIDFFDRFDAGIKNAGQAIRDFLSETLNLIDAQGIAERDAARATEEANEARAAAYAKMTKVLKQQLQMEKVELERAAATLAQWEEQYLGIVRGQEEAQDPLKNLTENWEKFEKILLRSGRTVEETAAIKERLAEAMVLDNDKMKAFVNTQKIAVHNSKLEAEIAGAVGNAKRELIVEQKIINDLYASGAILTDDLGKGLTLLAKIYPNLREEIEAARESLERLSVEATSNAAWVDLNNQLEIAQTNLDNARNSIYGTGLAAALAAKNIELLGRGIEKTGEFAEVWAAEMEKVRQIFQTDFATDLVKEQKNLEDQVKLANDAIIASTGSVIEEAKAIAVAAKEQEMLNRGVARGGEYWKENIALVNQLVDAQFTLGANQRIKDLQAEAALQDNIMESLFQSERTRSRLVELAQKEYELSQLYGAGQDIRKDRELELFKILQQRDAVLKHLQELSGAVDSMFSKAEDAIVEFAKTGTLQVDKLVQSIAEDFLRLELRHLILDPLQDLLGKGLGALGIGGGLLGKGLGGADMLFKAPLPVTIVGGLDITGDGKGGGLLGGLFNKATAKDAGGGATCGCIGEALKATTSESTKTIASAVTDTNKDIADAVSSNAEAISDSAKNTAVDIADEIGGKIEKPIEELGDIISEPLEKVSSSIKDIVPSIDKIAPSVKEGIMNLPGMDKVSTAAAETMMTKIPSRLSPIKPFSEWEITRPNVDADFMRFPIDTATGFARDQFLQPIQAGALTPELLMGKFDMMQASGRMGDILPNNVLSSISRGAPVIGGGNIFGSGAGLMNTNAMMGMGQDALGSINDSVLTLKDTFTELSDTTTNVISRFGDVTSSVSQFAEQGLTQAQDALTDFGSKALEDTATKAVETAAQTAEMGIRSGVTSAQITQLGTSASVAASQLSAAGAASGIQKVVGLGSISHLIPGFQRGGWTGGGNPGQFAGLVHKREFVFDEESTRNLGISTLEQIRAAAKRGTGGGGRKLAKGDSQDQHSISRNPESFKIINVMDPSIVADYMATREGEKLVMNIMRRNNPKGTPR